MKKMTAEEVSLAQHLIALGCPLDVTQGYRDTPAGLKFEQLPTPGTSQVFDLDKGGSGYVIDMRISSGLNLPIRIREVRIQTPWGLRDISLLPDPSQRNRAYQCYEFDGTGLAFHRSVVRNDFFLASACSTRAMRSRACFWPWTKSRFPMNTQNTGIPS